MEKIDLFKNAEIISTEQLTAIVGGQNSESDDNGSSEHHDNGESSHHDYGTSDNYDYGTSASYDNGNSYNNDWGESRVLDNEDGEIYIL